MPTEPNEFILAMRAMYQAARSEWDEKSSRSVTRIIAQAVGLRSAIGEVSVEQAKDGLKRACAEIIDEEFSRPSIEAPEGEEDAAR